MQESALRASGMLPILALADRLIQWNLPLSFFTVLYALTWACAIRLRRRFPPQRVAS